MSKRESFRLEDIKRQLIYILGRSPDEFGLLPDSEGFVKIKEIIQVLHEEGFRFVRKSHIDELVMWEGRELFETDEKGKKIKAKQWDPESCLINPVQNVPKILYACVRKRAHPVVMEKGLFNPDNSYVILSDSKEMALRIGKRKDPEPVLLEIRTYEAMEQGSLFFSFGMLYLSYWIPAQCISGPPVEQRKEKAEDKKKKEERQRQKEKIKEAFSAGTFFITQEKERKGKGKKKKGWKEEARKFRKRKGYEPF